MIDDLPDPEPIEEKKNTRKMARMTRIARMARMARSLARMARWLADLADPLAHESRKISLYLLHHIIMFGHYFHSGCGGPFEMSLSFFEQ